YPRDRVSGFDMEGAFAIDGQYAGATYIGDTLMYVLRDRTLQKHLDGLNEYFKHQANVILIAIDRAKKFMLIRVNGPRDPGDYYLYDIAHAHLEMLMSARPWLDPE